MRSETKQRITIRDVANHAGVSKSTVSKYLTSTPYVSDEAARHIENAINELGFRPSGAARAMSGGTTQYIGMLVPSISNPFQADLLEGIQRAAAPRNLSTLLAISEPDRERERELIRGLTKSGADGLIVTSSHDNDEETEELMRTGLPVVLAGRHVSSTTLDSAYVDNRLGAASAIRHLLALGHHKIAHVPGPVSVLDFKERAEWHERYFNEAGFKSIHLSVSEALQPGPETGKEAVRSLMQLPKSKRPSAVFAGADWIALGVLAEAARVGLKVPEDLSVVGFDNASICELSSPPLTTVDGQPGELGKLAVDLLHRRIQSTEPTNLQTDHRIVDPQIVERESTCAPRSG